MLSHQCQLDASLLPSQGQCGGARRGPSPNVPLTSQNVGLFLYCACFPKMDAQQKAGQKPWTPYRCPHLAPKCQTRAACNNRNQRDKKKAAAAALLASTPAAQASTYDIIGYSHCCIHCPLMGHKTARPNLLDSHEGFLENTAPVVLVQLLIQRPRQCTYRVSL